MKEIGKKIKSAFTNKKDVERRTYITLEPSKEKIRVLDEKGLIKIEILEACTLENFQCPIKIPIRILLREGTNLLNTKILTQTIYFYEENEYIYFISQNEDFIHLSQRIIKEDQILEIEVKVDKKKKNYSITKYIHDKNYSTKEVKKYPMKEDSAFQFFCLEKKEAICLLQTLINCLEQSNKIGQFFSLRELYSCIPLVPDKDFNPVIWNDKITLSVSRFFKDNDILAEKNFIFAIMLNETREKIGSIGYCYHENGGFTYTGNVYYDIEEYYQHQGYATLALELLKNLLQKNKVVNDKDLYISILPNNLYSQKVAVKNHGEVFYHGPVPKEEMLCSLDGVEEVVVYRIKLNK